MYACRHCGKTFNAAAHRRHEPLCEKVFQQKRKVFNPTEQRWAEVEGAEKIVKLAKKQTKKGEVGVNIKVDAPKTHWRQQSEAFRNAMRDAATVSKCQKEGKALPPPRATAPELDDRVPCPHCGRKFGAQQAERHIPHCKETKMKAASKAQAKGQAR